MKVSLNWIREIVDFKEDADALSVLLTNAGVEVEGVQTTGVAVEKVVVAQVLASEQHPNADRLSVCRVDDGSGEPLQIVCGAKNYKVGDKVPLARAGAVMPGNFKIKAGKLRGVESQGMMCSASELGLPEGEDGLLILDAGLAVGTPLTELFPGDVVLDLEITPNRADLLSHEGLAREVSALTGKSRKAEKALVIEQPVGDEIVVDGDGCKFYTARLIEGVQVGASPEWLKSRLEALGLRSISNVVDVTNWVMMEMGQPLHAFDADRLQGALRVRRAKSGELFLALDGKSYELCEEDLVIADDSGPVALAGVMGGEATGVNEGTKRVVLESAVFDAGLVRKTSRRLGLSSDSSYRFERGVDVAGVVRGSQRAAELIAEVAGGESRGVQVGAGNGVDSGALLHGLTPVRQVPLRLERVAELLGATVSEARVTQILSALGLSQSREGWEVPSFRSDLLREVDLIEEIARVVGIEHFPPRTRAFFSPASEVDRRYDRLQAMRRSAVGQGLFEARSLTLVSKEMAGSAFVHSPILQVKNPLNEDQVVLRPSLVPGLVTAAARNARSGVKAVRLFECGRVFSAGEHEERQSFAVVLSGPAWQESWKCGTVPNVDVFDLKGVLSAVLGSEVQFKPANASGELGLAMEIWWKGERIGMAGQWRPSVAQELNLTGGLVAAEICLEVIWREKSGPKRYNELPRFPAVTRDIAFVAPVTLGHQQVVDTLQSAGEALLAGVSLFDVFADATGVKIPVGKKSMAYSLTYRSSERTLVAEEVTEAHQRLRSKLVTDLGVQPRE